MDTIHTHAMTPTRVTSAAVAGLVLSSAFALGMTMQTGTAHAMTSSTATETTVTTTTDDYAGGAHYTDTTDTEDWSADTETDASCQGVAVWVEMWGSYGTDAQVLWDELVSMGWTNPADGNTGLLVQPGCA